MRKFLVYVCVLSLLALCPSPASGAPAKKLGILILARGVDPPGVPVSEWDQHVIDAVEPIKKMYDVELVLGLEPEKLQDGINKLQSRYNDKILVIPMYISTHSPVVRKMEYYLGIEPVPPERKSEIKPVEIKADIHMAHATEHNPLIAEVVYERTMEISRHPANETVILVAHGPITREAETMWLKSMHALASHVREKGGFKDATVATIMFGASPEVMKQANEDLRKLVEEKGRDGDVLVVPCLMAPGGIEGMLEDVLKGLKFRYGRPYLPHVNLTKWLKATIDAKLALWGRESKAP
ncbi:MAG: sirohydrochlorin chelatase [Candidatus Brocadiales bacterium]